MKVYVTVGVVFSISIGYKQKVSFSEEQHTPLLEVEAGGIHHTDSSITDISSNGVVYYPGLEMESPDDTSQTTSTAENGDLISYNQPPDSEGLLCRKVGLGLGITAAYCINIAISYIWVTRYQGDPSGSDMGLQVTKFGYAIIMVLANIGGMFWTYFSLFSNRAIKESFDNLNAPAKAILISFGLLFISASIGSPFISRNIVRMRNHNSACNNFILQIDGDGTTVFTYGKQVIGIFTWQDIDEQHLQIGFKANDDIFKKLNPNGISDIKYLISIFMFKWKY
jgi:hypothetical protein